MQPPIETLETVPTERTAKVRCRRKRSQMLKRRPGFTCDWISVSMAGGGGAQLGGQTLPIGDPPGVPNRGGRAKLSCAAVDQLENVGCVFNFVARGQPLPCQKKIRTTACNCDNTIASVWDRRRRGGHHRRDSATAPSETERYPGRSPPTRRGAAPAPHPS